MWEFRAMKRSLALLMMIIVSLGVLLTPVIFTEGVEKYKETGTFTTDGVEWTYFIYEDYASLYKADATEQLNSLVIPKYVTSKDGVDYEVQILSSFLTSSANGSNMGITKESIQKIYIPNTVRIIGEQAFVGFTNLKTVEFEEESSLVEIGDWAFKRSGNKDYSPSDDNGSGIQSNDAVDLVWDDSALVSNRMPIDVPVSDVPVGYVIRFPGTAQPSALYVLQGGSQVDYASAEILSAPSDQDLVVRITFYPSGGFSAGDQVKLLLADAQSTLLDPPSVSWRLTATFVDETPVVEPEEQPDYLLVKIPDSVETIGAYAFDCAYSVIISENSNLKYVGDHAFENVKTDIFIPSRLVDVGVAVFNPNVTLKVSMDNPMIAIDERGHLTTDGGTKLLQYFGNDVDYLFPSNIRAVGERAFYNNETIKTVIIPEGIDWDWFPFGDVVSLETVTFEDGIQTIPDYLMGYSSIKSVVIPSTVISIGEKAFYNTLLENVEVCDGTHLTEIKQYAFCYNPNLVKVVFGSHEQGYYCELKDGAFFYCNSLKNVIIDDGFNVQSIGKGAFAKVGEEVATGAVGALNPVSFGPVLDSKSIVIPKETEYVGRGAFSVVMSAYYTVTRTAEPGYRTMDSSTVWGYYDADGFTISFEGGSNIYSIYGNAFAGLVGVTEIDLSNCRNLYEIEAAAFSHSFSKNSATALKLPEAGNLSIIGSGAFSTTNFTVPKIAHLTVPASVVSIGSNAFEGTVESLDFEEGSMLESFEKRVLSPSSTADLSNCIHLRYVYVMGTMTLPAGAYEMEKTTDAALVNDDEVLFSNDSDALEIGEGIKAVNTLYLYGQKIGARHVVIVPTYDESQASSSVQFVDGTNTKAYVPFGEEGRITLVAPSSRSVDSLSFTLMQSNGSYMTDTSGEMISTLTNDGFSRFFTVERVESNGTVQFEVTISPDLYEYDAWKDGLKVMVAGVNAANGSWTPVKVNQSQASIVLKLTSGDFETPDGLYVNDVTVTSGGSGLSKSDVVATVTSEQGSALAADIAIDLTKLANGTHEFDLVLSDREGSIGGADVVMRLHVMLNKGNNMATRTYAVEWTKEKALANACVVYADAYLSQIKTISVDQANSVFSYEDGKLILGDELLMVDGVHDTIAITSDSVISAVRASALSNGSATSLVIDKEGISLQDGALSGAGSLTDVYLLHAGSCAFTYASFDGAPDGLRFYVDDSVTANQMSILEAVGTVMQSFEAGNYKVYIPRLVGSHAVEVLSAGFENGVFTADLAVEGGYTGYDLAFSTDSGAEVVVDGTSISLVPERDTAVFIAAKDRRSGDLVAVTFDGDGGTSSGSSQRVLELSSGLTVLDSEIPEFVRANSDFLYWADASGAEFDFGSPVTADILLKAVWSQRAPQVVIDVVAGDVIYEGSPVKKISNVSASDRIVLSFEGYQGYEPASWAYIVDGTMITCPIGEDLVLENVTSDITVAVTYTYFSSSSGLIPVVNRGLPTSEELASLVQIWELGGYIDKSESAWRGHSSVPLVVDDYLYMRAGGYLYKVEFDTGYVVAKVESVNTNAFYHQIGYGAGLVIDYCNDRVYDLDLNLLFEIDRRVAGLEYHEGYFYTSGTTMYRFPADASQAMGGVMRMEEVGTFDRTVYSSYGFSFSVFEGDYVYRVYADGKERGITAMCIDSGSDMFGESAHVALDPLQFMYLDDGWISCYDGVIFLGGYTVGLFGAVAVQADDALAYLSVDGFEFGEVRSYVFDGKRGFASQFVVSDGVGYIVAGGTLYAFRMGDDGMPVELLNTAVLVSSHGSITVDRSYATEENGYVTYVYMLPYQPVQSALGVVKCYFDGKEFIMETIYDNHLAKDYNSQAIRSGTDGQMVWYNDSGHLFGYTTPEKNVYYFFVDDGSQAGWYKAYGATPGDAAATLDSSVLSIDTTKTVSRMFGKPVSDATINVLHRDSEISNGFSWTTMDSFANKSYSTDHYFAILANGTKVSDLDVFSYVDGPSVSEYSFVENIGDRSLVGVRMAVGTDVSVIRFYEGGAEIEGEAMIGVTGSEVSGSLPIVYREGFIPVWTDADGAVVESLSGASFPEGGASYFLEWSEVPTYEVSFTEASAAPGTVRLSFDVLTLDADPLGVSVMLGFEDGTFVETASTVAASGGAASFSWSARAPGIPVQMALEISKGGVPVYQSFDNPFEGVGYTYGVGTVMVIDGLVYEVTSMEPEAATIVGHESAPSGKLVIPAALEVDGHSFVLTVGKKAFDRCYEITSVTIGADVEPYAFYGCSGLKVVRISDGVSSIGNSAFSSCPRISYVVIADSVSEIGKNAFYGYAFYSGDEKLDPTSEDLSGHKFTGKRTHMDVYVPPVGGVFSAGGLKYKIVSNGDEMSVALRGFSSEAFPDVTVPSSVRYLGFDWKVSSVADKAFYGNDVLASVTVEMDGSVGFKSFAACPSLESVAVTGSATLGSYSFASCPSLAVLDLSGVSEIGVSAFSGDKGLVSVAFSEGLVSVGKNAFFRNLFYDGSSKVPRTAAGLAGKAFAGSGGELFLSA